MPALPSDRIGPCMRQVKLALRRSNPDEAKAAIDFAFREVAVATLDSGINDLGLPPDVIGYLEKLGILTARQLAETPEARLLAIPYFGLNRLKKCRAAIAALVPQHSLAGNGESV